LEELLHGDTVWLEGKAVIPVKRTINIGIETEVEEKMLIDLNNWVMDQNLTAGTLSYELTDTESGEQKAIFDLAWPAGLQEELSQPVAVLINESPEVMSLASGAGFRCFTTVEEFKYYVLKEILNEVEISLYAQTLF